MDDRIKINIFHAEARSSQREKKNYIAFPAFSAALREIKNKESLLGI